MHKFKDNREREWSVSLNGWQLKRLKEAIDFDARDHESILRAAEDPALLCDVLYVLCEEQAKAANVTDREFGESLSGDVIDAATDAYLQESVDFFPQRQRAALKQVLDTMMDYQQRAASLATEKLTSPALNQLAESTIAEMSQKIDAILIGKSTGNSSGKSLASPA